MVLLEAIYYTTHKRDSRKRKSLPLRVHEPSKLTVVAASHQSHRGVKSSGVRTIPPQAHRLAGSQNTVGIQTRRVIDLTA